MVAIPFLLKAGALVVGGLGALSMLNPSPDFMQAYMINTMRGHSLPLLRTAFIDGLKSFALGSRSLSAMTSGGGFPGAMMMNPMMMGMMNPMMMGGMMNPMMMGGMAGIGGMSGMPFNPMFMSRLMWGF